MKRKIFQFLNILLFFGFCHPFQGLSDVYGQMAAHDGIQPLIELHDRSLHHLIPSSIQPLVLAQEIEVFLEKLEGSPPNWDQLRHSNITEQSERLFQFNRQRDKARIVHISQVDKPIAFLWSGILRQYLPEFQGFSIALGPEFTKTSWGIIRFKPINLADDLVAIPTLERRKQLVTRQRQGELVNIMVLCIGILVTDESLIYGFSHDGHQDGMILPVVSVQNIMYILTPS